jgi:hypothetical protein
MECDAARIKEPTGKLDAGVRLGEPCLLQDLVGNR